MPLCVFVFLLPDSNLRVSSSKTIAIRVVSILTLALVPVSVLLQVHFPKIAPSVMKYFVGSDMQTEYWFDPIRGVLATTTDLGAISGILCFVAIAFAAQAFRKKRMKSILFAVFSIVFIYIGLLSESRNFILFIVVAAATLSVASAWEKNRVFLVALLPSFITTLYFSAYVMPSRLVSKLASNIPHFDNVYRGSETSIAEVFPRLSVDSLGARGPLWESALRLIRENPLLGTSNGGFRLADDCACDLGNTHNIFLQSAIDAGVLGVLVMSGLLAYLIREAKNDKWSLAFMLGIVATLMVDNFTDHSYAWIVVASFASVLLARRGVHESR